MAQDEREHLCCCEYINYQGEKSHVLAMCCDCELLDDTCERWLTGKSVPKENYSTLLMVINDRLRVPWYGKQGALKVNFDVLLPMVLMPVSLLIAAQHVICTVIIFSVVPLLLLCLQMKCLRYHPRSRFFFSWSITSVVFLLLIFQLWVVGYLEILPSENFILSALITTSVICFFKVKKRLGLITSCDPDNSMFDKSKSNLFISIENDAKEANNSCSVCKIMTPPRASHCRTCNACVLRRDHHCIWIDCCIGEHNHRWFLLGLISLFAACLFGTNLTLSTVCFPLEFYGILVPVNCKDVYGTITESLCFVSAIYGLVIGLLTALAIVHQFILISKNLTLHEWHNLHRHSSLKYNQGIFKNWKMFLFDK